MLPEHIFYFDYFISLIQESLYGENCESSNQCSHMLTGSKCNSVCECAEGYTYIRGRCRELIGLNSPTACKEVGLTTKKSNII